MNITRPLRPTLPRSTTNSLTKTPHHPPQCLHKPQIRHATLIRRPLRPYTFTQLVTLSDGSTFTHRTTSPVPVYVSVKDTRNSQLWNPSSQKLLNVEADEAGKLKKFREKFGRGWDASAPSTGKTKDGNSGELETVGKGVGDETGQETGAGREEEDNLMDLISGYGREAEANRSKTGGGKGKSGEN